MISNRVFTFARIRTAMRYSGFRNTWITDYSDKSRIILIASRPFHAKTAKSRPFLVCGFAPQLEKLLEVIRSIRMISNRC
jgi:hypothetical protein